MSKPWGGVGAWALEAERAEAEERAAAEAALLAGEPPQSFPTLKEAAATKPKKKKPVPLSLSDFSAGSYDGPGGNGAVSAPRREPPFDSKFLTHDEKIRLPTGPRERSAEEFESNRLGGGFRSYGYGAGPASGGGRRPYGGGFDEEQRRGAPSPRVSDLDQPSRADEVDNWAAGKKSFTPMDHGPGRQHDRYGSLGSGSSSKADEVDNWVVGKKSVPSSLSSYPRFGSGFRDSSFSSDSDRWGGRGLASNGEQRERPRLVLDPPKGDVVANTEPVNPRPSPFGTARPREEVLAEKGVDWRKIDTESEIKKTSRPSSSHSSRPSSAQSSRPGSPGSQAGGEGAPKARSKVNPFGDARPREVLLEEKGHDWRKIDLELEHRRVDRPQTDEEKLLKEEISYLKEALAKETGDQIGDMDQRSAEQVTSLHEQICQKEKDLGKLIRGLDDKVRFGQKAISDMKPGLHATRTGGPSERLSSQPGTSDEWSNMELTDRPRSRGTIGDSWAKPMTDRREFSRW